MKDKLCKILVRQSDLNPGLPDGRPRCKPNNHAQCDQITAASWSGDTCKPTIMQPITFIRILFVYVLKIRGFLSQKMKYQTISTMGWSLRWKSQRIFHLCSNLQKKRAKSLSWALFTSLKDAQDSNLAPFFLQNCQLSKEVKNFMRLNHLYNSRAGWAVWCEIG